MRPEAVPGLRGSPTPSTPRARRSARRSVMPGPVANARIEQGQGAGAGAVLQSARRCGSPRRPPRDDIDDIIDAHADAARLAIDAGFDAVEIHLGHNYLASSFLSPLINRRNDEFGGSLENRAKVARGVVMAVRARSRRRARRSR